MPIGYYRKQGEVRMFTSIYDPVGLYRRRTPKSAALYERASKVMPGGNTRTVRHIDPYPIYTKKASGSRVTDIDGNEYIDLTNNQTALLLGHNHPRVVEAVRRQVEAGHTQCDVFSSELEISYAELICEASPCVESVRFSITGTEATMNIFRLVRAFTGRKKVAKFEGQYLGTHDYAMMSVSFGAKDEIGPIASPNPIPWSIGIPECIKDTIIVLPWNELEACEQIISKNKKELAGIVVDPSNNSQGHIPPGKDFLKSLKEIAEKNDVLLVFDETITGFRLAYGGAQEKYGVKPDLATFAKNIGGGYPLAAFGGREDIMDTYTPPASPKIQHSGTFNACPISLAAGKATLETLAADGDVYKRINEFGAEFRTKVTEMMHQRGILGMVTGSDSLFHVRFTDATEARSIRDLLNSAKPPDSQLEYLFGMGGLTEGVYTTPKQNCNISAAVTRSDMNAVFEAVGRVLDKLKSPAKERGLLKTS
jgi:glutamate-1-semialdehyde 2,1-aminomutase